MNQVKLYVRLEVRDAHGKIVRRTRRRLSRSFVIGFLKHLEAGLRHSWQATGAIIAIIDTGNVSRDINVKAAVVSHEFFSCHPLATDDTYGIVCGANSTAPTNNNYALGTQIAEGSGAGQMNHGTHTYVTSAVVGANVDFVMQRTFVNNSGGAITVEECGIYVKTEDTAASARILCIVRDVTGGVAVGHLQTLTVSYTFRTAV